MADEFADRFKAARGDVEQLWELVNWCEARGMMKERDRTLKAILREKPDDEKARGLLGHLRFDGQWFTSEKKLAAYKKKKEREEAARLEREAKEKGWIRHDGRWIDPRDLVYIERGWVRLEDGTWVSPEDKERLDAGWVRQDLEWVAPADVKKMRDGLWKCGEDWLALAEAEAWHAELDRWWRIPGFRSVVWSTLGREQSEKAVRIVDDVVLDMERLFGRSLSEPPAVLVLRDRDQYVEFAKLGVGRIGKSIQGTDSLKGAFFPDLWIDEKEGFVGVGIAYWNAANESEDRWGSLWIRYAAAHSFIEAIDSSPEARSALAEGGSGIESFARGFWEEKLLPSWLRYGAATYAERYFIDPRPTGGNDPSWARKWSAGELASKGGLGDLDSIIEFSLSMDDTDAALLLMSRAGLLVSFLLDGGNEAMEKALGKFHEAMRLNESDAKKGPAAVDKALRGIERALKKNQKELAAFAGF